MSDLQKQIAQIKSFYPQSELKKIFTLRLDDELFFTLGRMALKGSEPVENHIYVWTGFEKLIGFEARDV